MGHWKILAILFLATFLGFFKLSQVPPSLDWDEVAIGWNAKTIWETRRDEFGTRLPLSFQSFGDYKAPLYIYLTAPVVGIFGASELSVRLVSVVAGIVSVGLVYLISKSHLAAMLLVLSPWHLLMSRPAFEPNLALMFILGGVWFFLIGLKKPAGLILSLISFGLSLYSYQSPKIFVPVFGAGMLWIYRRHIFLKKNRTYLVASALVGIVMFFPLISDLDRGGAARFQGTSIFYRDGVNLLVDLPKNYLIHFSPWFLFWGGRDIPRVQMSSSGLLLLATVPWLIFGVVKLWKTRNKLMTRLLIWWLIAAPIPAMIGYEVPHPIRAYQLLPVLVIIAAIGWKKSWLSYSLLAINAGFVWYSYLVWYPVMSAPDWQFGYKAAVKTAARYEDQVDKIIITGKYGQPHIFTYWYQDRAALAVFWGAMSKYLYRDINWVEDEFRDNVLLIGTPAEIPANHGKVIEVINFPDGTPAFVVAKT